MGQTKTTKLDLSVLPEMAQREVIDFFEFIKTRHLKNSSKNQAYRFKALKISTKQFKFDRDEANER